jgi:hypothetical protein
MAFGVCWVCGVDGATCFGGAVAGQGLASGVSPVISGVEDGRPQKFLLCLHAIALVFCSAQPCLRGGLGTPLSHGTVGAVAG